MSARLNVYLSKAQRNLLGLWNRELSDKITAVQQLANECFNGRLESLAEELGVDLKNEKWGFDNKENCFYPIEEPAPLKKPTEVIPSKKRGRPRKDKEVVIEGIVEPAEPELPDAEIPN
jgi:hypothetical protein